MALIPPFFSDCVVAIGATDDANNKRWVGSGFLYGCFVRKTDDARKMYRVYLVTNRHVLSPFHEISLRFNPEDNQPPRDYTISLADENGVPRWIGHPRAEIDVAVIPINFELLKQHAMRVAYFRGDDHASNVEQLRTHGVTEGDFVYVLGFPMALVGDVLNTVVVRSGSIARIRDMLAGAADLFLLDAFVFPGNSGGPVVLKPEAISIEGTQAQNRAQLIGIVQSYVPYQDVGVSLQTQRTRIVFEENSGLAAAHTIDAIEQTIAQHRAQFHEEADLTPPLQGSVEESL